MSPCFQSAADKTATKRVGLVSTSRLLNTVSPANFHFFCFFSPHPHLISSGLLRAGLASCAGGNLRSAVPPLARGGAAAHGPLPQCVTTLSSWLLLCKRLRAAAAARALNLFSSCNKKQQLFHLSLFVFVLFFFVTPACCNSILHFEKWLRP